MMKLRSAAMLAGLTLGLISGTAVQAAYIANIEEINLGFPGPSVLVTGSGSLDLNALTFDGRTITLGGMINPTGGSIIVGGRTSVREYNYDGTLMPYGSNPDIFRLASLSTGVAVGLFSGAGVVYLPSNYELNSQLGVSTNIYYGADFASLGLTPGSYSYRISNGSETEDSFTINIGLSPVPLPASAPMFGAALLALGAVGYGLKRKKAAAAI